MHGTQHMACPCALLHAALVCMHASAHPHLPHLIVGCPEPPPDILVIKHLHLKAEILLQVLDDHHEEGQLDA